MNLERFTSFMHLLNNYASTGDKIQLDFLPDTSDLVNLEKVCPKYFKTLAARCINNIYSVISFNHTC